MFKLALKAGKDCKLYVEYKNKEDILYSNDIVEINEELEENEVVRLYCKETTDKDIKKILYLIPLRLISTIFDIIFQVAENWTEGIEPYSFCVDINIDKKFNENELAVKYFPANYNESEKKFIEPRIFVDDIEYKLKCFKNQKNLTKCFVNWLIKMIIIFIYTGIIFGAIVVYSPHIFPYWHGMFVLIIGALLLPYGYLFKREYKRLKNMRNQLINS